MYIKKVLTKLWQLLEKRQNSRKEDGTSELRTEHYWGKSQGYNIILLLLCMPKWCNLAIKGKKKHTSSKSQHNSFPFLCIDEDEKL